MSVTLNLGLFTNDYVLPIFLKALVVGVLTAACASVLGVPLVLKRYSMIGDGLSHMGFLALAIATIAGVSDFKQIYITTPIVIAAAVLLLLMSESGKMKGDAAIAILSTGSVALGYVISTVANSGSRDVCSSLFGSAITALSSEDVIISIVLAAGVLLTFLILYNKLFAVTFDPAFAAAVGTGTKGYSIIIAVLTAVTIVLGMKLIGSIMISAVIVFPTLAAMKICSKFKSVIIASAVISILCFVIGLFFATVVKFYPHTQGGVPAGDGVSLPVGPCVVLFNALALLCCMAIREIRIRVLKRRTIK